MQWKTKLLIKHFSQKILGCIPKLWYFQELYKGMSGHWSGRIDKDEIKKRIESKIDFFNQANILPPKTVVEQGTGWHGVDLLLFYVCGAEKIYSYDTRPWLRKELISDISLIFQSLEETILKWKNVDKDIVHRRLSELSKVNNDLSLLDILNIINVKYTISTKFKYSNILNDSIDFFYSDSVLQRMQKNDLTDLVTDASRYLKTGGVAFHIVSCRDFHCITDSRVPDLYYLQYSDKEWRLITSKYLNYQNRLRITDYINLFDKNNLQTNILRKIVKPSNIEYVENHLVEKPEFKNMSIQDIAASQVILFANKTS